MILEIVPGRIDTSMVAQIVYDLILSDLINKTHETVPDQRALAGQKMEENILNKVFRIFSPVPSNPFADIAEQRAIPFLVSVRDPVLLTDYGAGFGHGFKCSTQISRINRQCKRLYVTNWG
jgi:hypothetical protein